MLYSQKKYTVQLKSVNTTVMIILFVLSILPVLSPYAFYGSITLNSVILLFSVFILFITRSKFNIKLSAPIILLWLSHLTLSLLIMIFTDFSYSLINSLIAISITVFCFTYLWSNCFFDYFVKMSNYIGVFACLFLLVQALFLILGLDPPSGRVFNLPLLEYAGFVSTTWGFRLNSIFQEPSYFAMYTLPLLAFNLHNGKKVLSLLYVVSLVLSTSSLGIFGVFLIVAHYFFVVKRSFKQFSITIFIFGVIHLFLYKFVPFYSHSVSRSVDKISNISEQSTIRFSGQIDLFQYLSFSNQLMGIGVNQMQNFFVSFISGVYNYSNSFVITLINTGIIGLIFYLLFIVSLFKISYKSSGIIYFLIFIVAAATDYFIYNFFFFYILTFILLEKESGLNNESVVCNTEVVGDKLVSYTK